MNVAVGLVGEVGGAAERRVLGSSGFWGIIPNRKKETANELVIFYCGKGERYEKQRFYFIFFSSDIDISSVL
jgi:hypothetical protein